MMQPYISQPMQKYLDDLAGKLDAPGGGSACGLVGALASALGSMVCHFTLGKKKYEEVAPRIQELLDQFERERKTLTDLMQADVDIFHSQMGYAYGLPKDTDEQKQIRREAIEKACKAACQPPLNIARCCRTLMSMLIELGEKGTIQLVSDVGVAAALAKGAFDGALLNVEINLKYIADTDFIGKVRTEIEPMKDAIACETNQVMQIVHDKIGR